jgi:Zn-dependent protease with chaperone function
MDFFEHQERARRKTLTLVLLFALAVLGIVTAVYVRVALTLGFAGELDGVWHPELLLAVSAATLLLVGLGTLYKMAQLRAGGAVVAQQLGGRLIPPNTADPAERVVLNVVEEMAVASGIPVPAVYLMDDEAAINAFAAGLEPAGAVIGVTRGCLAQLDRDELQGVVAHEFSHIFNGDMRLNLRLVGLLHGIVCIALAGYLVLRSGAGSTHRRSGKGAGGAVAILAVGAGLVAIGSIGTLFARLIQAAVSRQREFLADASAVQFTRNPTGIAGALRKIGGFGARVERPQAVAFGHMFFGSALRPAMFDALATHPPLAARIARIDRHWRPEPAAEQAAAAAAVRPEELIARIGTLHPTHVQQSRRLLDALPLAVATSLHEPFLARALVYALLLDGAPAARRRQLEALAQVTDAATLHETAALRDVLAELGPELRLPLVDLALPALREMSFEQHHGFARGVRALVAADAALELFELVLQKVLLRHVSRHFERPPLRRTLPSLISVKDDCRVLLSRLAHTGSQDASAIHAAYRRSAAALPAYANPGELLAPADCDLPALDRALDRLDRAAPRDKRTLLLACAAAVEHDGELRLEEAELLRAVADALGCPVPLVAEPAATPALPA